MLYIGLISGTSADGIDGALVDIGDEHFELLAARCRGFAPGLKDSIESVISRYPGVDAAELEQLDEALGADFAAAALELVEAAGPRAEIRAVGSHGQTVYHGPGDDPPVTIQLGNPRTIARMTGLTTVGDFRSNDLRAGGQGAPLAPAFHNTMFRNTEVDRFVVNIGGIANLTRLPADPAAPVLGFDSGPGNTLMDRWCLEHTGAAYDEDGWWAAAGRVNESFVHALLTDPYLSAPAPKSTGREYFHLDWVKKRYPGWRTEEPVDIQAGLLEVTARSIVQATEQTCGGQSHEIYVCGGGAWNAALMGRLASLSGGTVQTTDALGLSPDCIEACAFAWLAHRRIHDQPGNLPSVTGAKKEVLLGEVCTPGR